ncbi:LysM peptidoglycan-binding domain-containing protein [Bacillus sp. CLL-7-23]|uniref:LysM peptidoglycan-binding domain-containing protein n=1 Tax=Bacillus changyiensis TaxID=3004103 RepID=A0ABT4X3M8_9BACI|nr:LysM peptidoglycan-binding domain-containing protein [Bacillus changyiensis]MDA7026770.1 LysM peptidoglycan-binding domain-containing protein [Bacillus changyiensis]
MKKTTIIACFTVLMFSLPNLANAQYYVKKGDTLTGIAKKHHMRYADLKSLNPQFTNPNLIHVGDFVVVRSKNKAKDLVEYARSLQDVTTYVYGGKKPPTRTDCSGWVQHVYKKFGVKLPRTSRDQAKVGQPISFRQLKIGDLMFFSTRADKVITHVGIHMGKEYWISNLSAKQDVEILSTWGSWTQKYFLWGQRVL